MLYKPSGNMLLERIAAFVVLMLASPFYGVLAFLIWLKLGKPVLFRQQHPGLHC